MKNFRSWKSCCCSYKEADSTVCRVLTAPRWTERSSCVRLLARFAPTPRGQESTLEVLVFDGRLLKTLTDTTSPERLCGACARFTDWTLMRRLRSEEGRREEWEGFSRGSECTHTHTHSVTHLCSAHLHMKGQGWKVFPVERGRICVLTPNC